MFKLVITSIFLAVFAGVAHADNHNPLSFEIGGGGRWGEHDLGYIRGYLATNFMLGQTSEHSDGVLSVGLHVERAGFALEDGEMAPHLQRWAVGPEVRIGIHGASSGHVWGKVEAAVAPIWVTAEPGSEGGAPGVRLALSLGITTTGLFWGVVAPEHSGDPDDAEDEDLAALAGLLLLPVPCTLEVSSETIFGDQGVETRVGIGFAYSL